MNRDMRVLYISGKRGVESPLLEYLAEKENDFSFLQFKLHIRSMHFKAYCKSLFQIFKVLKKYCPTIILMEGPGISTLIAIPIKKIYKIPIAIRVKGDLWAVYSEISHSIRFREKIRKFLNYRAASLVLKSADMVIPISKNIENKVRSQMGEHSEIITVHIPLKTISMSLSESNYRRRGKYVLTVTNFNFWKKVAPLAEAVKAYASLLKKRGLSWVILGDGFFLDEFRRAIQEQLSRNEISLLGRQDPATFYREAKALFYISGLDGLPNVILEASMYGLPIFMNHDCPAVEFIKDGYGGVVVDFASAERVNAVLDMIEHKDEEMDNLAEKAREYFGKNFSVEKISADILEALKGCVAARRQLL